MRYVRIFLLYLQNVLAHRGRSVVWFFISLSSPILMIIFWKAAFSSNNTISHWEFNTISIYYFFLLLINTIINAHIEESISELDVRNGELVRYLLHPLPYYLFKFFEEIPYRLFQGSLAVVMCFIVFKVFNLPFDVSGIYRNFFAILLIVFLAFFLIFTFKMILGLLAFWLTQTDGVYDVIYMITYIFGGYLMPLDLFNGVFKDLSLLLPFSYMIYYPVMILMNKLPPGQILQVIIVQLLWLVVEVLIYKYLWKKAVRQFTAVGQ